MKKELYNKEFFKNHINGTTISAREIVPILLDNYKPKSVVDIGCGSGSWLNEFYKAGIKDILGIDGSKPDKNLLQIPKEKFISIDLENLSFQKINKRFDLAISLEVAEHIKIKFSERFVDLLTKLSDVILFSAAIPYQGGTNHINENWTEFWIYLFNKKGYQEVDLLREKIWNNKKVNFWYKQNILIFIKKEKLNLIFPYIDNTKLKFNTYIHPELFLWTINRDKDQSRFLQDIKYYKNIINNKIRKKDIINYSNTYQITYKKISFYKKIKDKLNFRNG
jgi:SAM-dependent methyltransferase